MSQAPEDYKFLEKFLREVSSGRDFAPDIWIEREVKPQGEGGEAIKAKSSSTKIVGKQINNLTELLEDDIDYCFNQGRFVFRFITAIAGSGKTTLLSYFRELIEARNNDSSHSIVISFDLPAKLRVLDDASSFHTKFYTYILAETFWQILSGGEIRFIAEDILQSLLDNDQFNQLIQARNFEIGFLGKFISFFRGKHDDLQAIFLSTISKVSETNSQYAFVYLIDELDDALKQGDNQSQMREVFKSLINKLSSREYKDEIKLLMYLAGTSSILQTFITSEEAIERRFSHLNITLGSGLNDEFEKIREKINRRLEGAYNKCDGFEDAFRKIQAIDQSLRSRSGNARVLGNYCRDYAHSALEIYSEYFSDKSECHFAGSKKQLKDLVSSLCKDYWQNYLSRSEYQLKIVEKPDNPNEHAFDCYANLIKNGETIASAYGGARNYELLAGYVEWFMKRLDNSNFRPKSDAGEPSDLCFILSPESCSALLARKLALKSIQLINLSEKDAVKSAFLAEKQKEESQKGVLPETKIVDVNLATEKTLLQVFQGTNIRKDIIKKIIESRPYENIEELKSKVSGIGSERRKSIQEKLDNSEICFRFGVFISYNSKDKTEVDSIVKELETKHKILCWIDDKILGGQDVRKKLEEIISSDRLWSAAIFYGSNGPGPWQEAEISSFFQKYVKQNRPIVPVLLKSCIEEPQISPLLGSLKYVDFRNKKKSADAIDELVRSIRGE
jgi:hypothetical protein